MKNFALTGAAGYIAPRHYQAIRDTGNTLLAAVDPHDSVGILDRYFPDTSFFTEYERFDRHLEKLKRTGDANRIHYLSICSPNNLHDAHIRTALRVGADAICEKPLVLNPWNLDILEDLEREYDRRVWTILQLRVHPSLVKLKHDISQLQGMKCRVRLTYITSRGVWYHFSWKGDKSKSGGIATNIGIHFFDMLIWLFGDVRHSWLHLSEADRMAGFLELKNAEVEWFLSINRDDLPASASESGLTTYRSVTVDGKEVEFSGGFTDLHTRVYDATLSGNGFGISDARPSIELVQNLRSASVERNKGELHILLTN